MAYVEPQHNAAKPATATRGVRMTDDGKDADLRIGDPQPSTVAEAGTPPRQNTPRPAADAGTPRVGPRALSEHTRTRLATQLRAMYDTVAQQPVPDRFAALIAQLDDAERGKR